MFQRTLFIASLLVIVGIISIYFYLVRYNAQDEIEYRRLVQTHIDFLSRKGLEQEPVEQVRTDVQKDIWRIDGEDRLHFRLKSASSYLSLLQKKGKMEAVERLKQIECVMQEEINQEMQTQQLRVLKAEEGTYSFPAHCFKAKTVDLAFYQLPEIEIPFSLELEKPFLRGIAHNATLSAKEKTPNFHAKFLKLRLENQQVR
jgi:putative lipase involved disintegration of autophagic bodies